MTTRSAFRLIVSTAMLLCTTAAVSLAQRSQPRILVFSKTAGFRHTSIEPGIAAVKKLAKENGFSVDATEDATAFNDENLKQYQAVMFLSTTGDVLDAEQQDAFERYIQAGGGWVGVHSATDTEYDWPWYGRLAGAYFTSHPLNPNVRKATFRVLDKSHPSTTGLPDKWEREDEFYNFKSISPDIHVLIDIDEKTYQGGTNGDHHPMSWYHDFNGGRAFYTNMGHTDATFTEAPFLKHLLGGLRYAIGTGKLDYSKARPEENRFTKVILAEALNEPVELAVLPHERVLFVERHGAVKLYTPSNKRVTTIATIKVSTKYADSSEAEDGLLGLAADPGVARNGWVYMYYSPSGPAAKNVLSRFTMKGDSLDLSSEKVMLEIPVQRNQCCHTGGSIAFDRQGNLFLSTGDNTSPRATGYAPIDERPDRSPWDAQKSSANTNDLRGKIVRIHPQPDGTYTIPAGNLFAAGMPKTRPEIYTMGHRNPYRIAVDQHTGFLYWGDVGPDATRDSVDRGPAGHDEIGQARRAGNFGWPYFVADNKAYYDVDFATMTAHGLFDAAHPVNESPNNTGMRDLPPAEKAFIWYPAGPSAEFPIVGTGGRTAMAGPVYYRGDFRSAARAFPQYYDGKLLTYEWMRGWIMAVTMNANGDLASMERFMPSTKFSNPMDMEFAPNGDLYLLEYGTRWFQGNDDARLVRLEYNAGNRAPVVLAAVDKSAGPTPMRVALSSTGTADADGDAIRYQWTIKRSNGTVLRTLSEPNPSLTLDQPGEYTATLTATDPQGARGSAQVKIVAGNEPPVVAIDVTGNRTFFFPGAPISYAVRVTDREDGSLESGRIPADRVTVSATYLKDGVPKMTAASGHQFGAAPVAYAEGKRLIEAGTCLSCHQLNAKSIGPAYSAVADKYRSDATAAARLATKIREGGSGVWGQVTMPPHPQLTLAQTTQMTAYILSLGAAPKTPSLPVSGTYTPDMAKDSAMKGAVMLRASYIDQGGKGLPGAGAEQTVVLRVPTLVVASGEVSDGVTKFSGPTVPVEITIGAKSGAYVGFKGIDLTGISDVVFSASAPVQYLSSVGGKVEVRLDKPTGPLLGETSVIAPAAEMSGPPTMLRAALQPTSGVHDVYFVFRNADAKEGQNLFILTTATFGNAPR
ncbi:MAG: carbohydrate-binding protein [Gemmatimonadetes bacterium]|nr:carbohydrate-binding protein [Gemmatimonadota bacterium]